MDVSVVIPTYNRPKKLSRAVTSLTEQTRQPDEVIIVNDGSSKSYVPTREELENIDEGGEFNIKYIEFEENQGACQARNHGAKKATGEVLMFLDDDDRWLPEKIECQLHQLSDTDLTYCSRRVVNEKGEFLHYSYAEEPKNPQLDILINNYIGTTVCVAMRKEVFEAAGRFDTSMPAKQDHELWIRILDHCDRIVVGTEPLVEWTVHRDGSKQISGQPDRIKCAIDKLLQKHKNRFKELSWRDMRRVRAEHHARLAANYTNAGENRDMQRYHALKSIYYWPTLSGAFRLLPEEIRPRLRSVYQNYAK